MFLYTHSITGLSILYQLLKTKISLDSKLRKPRNNTLILNVHAKTLVLSITEQPQD